MSEDRNHFLHDLSTRLGVPDFRRETAAKALLAWWQSEGGATDADLIDGLAKGQETDWNPFNTTLVVPGHSHRQPGNLEAPVQVYDSREVGMKATVDTLNEARYAPIRKALVTRGVRARTICNRIIESDWGTSAHPMLDVLEDITKRGLYGAYSRIRVYPS